MSRRKRVVRRPVGNDPAVATYPKTLVRASEAGSPTGRRGNHLPLSLRSPGETSGVSGPGRQSGRDTVPGPRTVSGIRSSTRSWCAPTTRGGWTGQSRWTPRSARAHQHGTNLERTTGGTVNHENLRAEPPDHALGRSRGRALDQDPPARRRPRPAAGDPLWPRPGRRFTDVRARYWTLSRWTVLVPAVPAPDRTCCAATRPTPPAPPVPPSVVSGIKCVIPEPRDQQKHRRNQGFAREVVQSGWTPRPTVAATSSSAATATSSNGADWPRATTNLP